MTNVTPLCLSWEPERGREDQYLERRNIKSVKHSQCLKGSIRDFVNQSSQHKCYCGESDAPQHHRVVTIITSHSHPSWCCDHSQGLWCPTGADNGLRLFSDVDLLLFGSVRSSRNANACHFNPNFSRSSHSSFLELSIFIFSSLSSLFKLSVSSLSAPFQL